MTFKTYPLVVDSLSLEETSWLDTTLSDEAIELQIRDFYQEDYLETLKTIEHED